MSWVVPLIIVGLGLLCLRLPGGRRGRNACVGSVVVGALSYLWGAAQVVFADPARMCDTPSWPRADWDRFEERFLPPRAACHWDDGRTQDLVSPWVVPALSISFGLAVACLVTLAVARHRKEHKR
ncbi:hypothetical protein DF19_28520 [Streptomyces olindensis]|nr:hypothetical protein DF19_28520 [Streptomyces olindensis]